jgi:hypothetical protein
MGGRNPAEATQGNLVNPWLVNQQQQRGGAISR